MDKREAVIKAITAVTGVFTQKYYQTPNVIAEIDAKHQRIIGEIKAIAGVCANGKKGVARVVEAILDLAPGTLEPALLDKDPEEATVKFKKLCAVINSRDDDYPEGVVLVCDQVDSDGDASFWHIDEYGDMELNSTFLTRHKDRIAPASDKQIAAFIAGLDDEQFDALVNGLGMVFIPVA